MEKLSNDEFISFLESFKDNKKYYDTITEIAKPIYNNGSKGKSLFYSSFKIYSLDDMKHDCKLFKHNFPKSTDGIYYKVTKDGDLAIILIEFKGIDFSVDSSSFIKNIKENLLDLKNSDDCPKIKKSPFDFDRVLNNFNFVENRYGDSVEYGLYLKIFETIYLTIPTIYKEYCKNNGLEVKDIDRFLRDHQIDNYVFVASNSRNPSQDYNNNLSSRFNKYSKKLIKGGIIDNSDIFTRYEMGKFENIIKKKIIIDQE